MSDNVSELIFESHRGQAQFAYFQLGAAGGAIAFAIHETNGQSLTDTPWPIGLAVALWALSFALGIFGLDARQGGLTSNAGFLRLMRGIDGPTGDAELDQAIENARSTVESDLKRPGTRFGWQKWALFAGALAYIAGHIMQMAAVPSRAPEKPGAVAPAKQPVSQRR